MNRRVFLHRSAATAAGVLTQTAFAASDDSYQIGCYTRPWDQFEYRVALDGIAEAGFTHAGLMTAKGKSWVIIHVDSTPDEVAAVAAEARQRHLKIVSTYGGDLPVARSVEAGVTGLKRLIDHCLILECPNLMLGGTTDDKLFAPYYKAIAECCPYAADKRVGLSIKPHGGQNATGPQCRAIIEKIGHPSFRLWYDPGNIFYYSDGQLDPVADSATVDGLVSGMSVKDFLPPKNVAVTPGNGRVNFAKVLARLRQGGFTRGPLAIECLAPGTAAEVTAAARKTKRYLEDLVARL